MEEPQNLEAFDFLAAANITPDPIVRYDKDCRRVFVNHAFAKLAGAPAESLLHKTPSEHPLSPNAIEYERKIRAVFKSGHFDEYEFCFKPDRGAPVTFLVRIVPEHNLNGEITCVMCVGHDISKRKQAEHALQILTVALNRSADAVFLNNESLNFIYANDAACRKLGYSREEFTRMTALDIDPDLDLKELNSMVASCNEAGDYPPFERRHQARDGRIFPVEISTTVTYVDGQKYVLSFCRDISENNALQFALRKSHDFLDGIFSNIPNPVFVKDRHKRWVHANNALTQFVGLEHDEILGKLDFEFFTVSEALVCQDGDEFVLSTGQALTNDETLTNQSGETRHIQVRKSRLDLGDNETYLVGVITDFTESKQAERVIRENQQHLSDLINFFPDPILAIDQDKKITIWNHAIEKMSGIPASEMIGKGDYAYTIPFYGYPRPQFMDLLWDQKHAVAAKYPDLEWDGDSIVSEVFCPGLNNGEGRHLWIKASPLRDSEGNLIGAIECMRDITERKRHEEELKHVANHDTVTGLPNRRLLTDRMEQAVARSRRTENTLLVCYLDFDNFKPINDQFGHATGDQILIDVSQRIKGVMRAEDTLARLGGDEFVLLFSDIKSLDEVRAILDRLLRAVNSPLQVENNSITLSASIGATLYPEDNVDADTLLRHADQAMYRAKEEGKNRFHLFDPNHERQLQEHRHHTQRLRLALERDEFVLHYQPKVDLLGGKVIGAEALIRWQHPEKGLLPPSEFLKYIEGNDLEISVGEWVVDNVLKQIEAWCTDGIVLPVSANIGAGHILCTDFAERLQSYLERHQDVSPNMLELEIIESAAISEMAQAVNTLNQCRELGVRVSLDDFGTGYSSLTYLRNLPIDTLKIDRSFISNMHADSSDLGIVVSVLQLAQALGHTVIAEGVETLEQGSMLVDLGCRMAQGFGIARPMPAENIPVWLEKWAEEAIWKNLSKNSVQPEIKF